MRTEKGSIFALAAAELRDRHRKQASDGARRLIPAPLASFVALQGESVGDELLARLRQREDIDRRFRVRPRRVEQLDLDSLPVIPGCPTKISTRARSPAAP